MKIERDIEIPNSVLTSKEFFNELIANSIVDLRNKLDILFKNNTSYILYNRVKNYELSLINSISNNLFNNYNEVLDNPTLLNEIGTSYILDEEILESLKLRLEIDEDKCYFRNKNEVIRYLSRKTNYKLSEIIIDYLFEDTIYNVFLNINEMLRYNEKYKILDEETIVFYKMILDIDDLSLDEKIVFFNKYKDNNINYKFYNDLRILKNDSYKHINEDIKKVSEMEEYKDDELSLEYDVDVLDLRDKEFKFLVRSIYNYEDTCEFVRNCYSLISNYDTSVFNSDAVLYGYDHVDIDRISSIFEEDVHSTNTLDSSVYVNRIMSTDEIIDASDDYNEIQIMNKKIDDNTYESLRPSFVIALDEVTNKEVRESRKLGIPIVLINYRTLNRGFNSVDY